MSHVHSNPVQRAISLIWLMLVLSCAAESPEQTLPRRWRWSNPTPHGANVFDMAYGLGLTVQVGERGQVLVSEDLSSWTPKDTGTTRSLRAVLFFNNRLVITGEAGTVLYADSLEAFNLVELATTDWLEGVASSGNTLVAVGDNAAIYSSSDGASWTRQSPPNGVTSWLRGIAYGNGKFVAVGENGRIITASSTAKNWSTGSSGVSTHLNRIAYINNTFWVAGDSGVVLKSSNGTSWSTVSGVGATNSLYTVAGTNSLLLVAGASELRLTQNGGTTWTSELSTAKPLPARAWTYYSAVWEDSLFFIAGRSGMMLEGFSTNATDYIWVQRSEPLRPWLWGATRTPDFYVAVGDHGAVMTSGSGVDWHLELVPDSVTNSVLLGIGGTTNGLVAVGGAGTIIFSPNTLTNVVFTNLDLTKLTNITSTVGTLWRAVTPAPTVQDLQGVTVSNGLFVVTGAGGTILTSTNGTNWLPRVSSTTKFLSGVEAFPGGLVASGDGGTILTSPDGTVWSAQNSGVTNWLFRVRWLGGQLVAVGEEGMILTSPSGTMWTKRTSGTTAWLNDVGYVAGTYYTAGNQGTVLASASGTTWTNVGTLTQKSLYGLAANGGQLITVGVEGVILRTQLQALVDPVKFVTFGRDGATDDQVFLINAQPDVRFTIQSSSNLVDWISGADFEILDPSGSILFHQKAADTSALREFFRALTIHD